jgi:hypothetical protein
MNNNSYADVIRNWEKLLDACNQNAAALPGFEPFRDALAKLLSDTKSLKSDQDNFAGNRQATTQQVKSSVTAGWKAARQLRAFVKAHLGADNEHLVQFQVQPIRTPRTRKPKAPEVPVPTPEVATPEVATPEAAQAHDEAK